MTRRRGSSRTSSRSNRSSTECTAPPRSAHVPLDDVPRALDPVELHGRVSLARRRGDGYDEVTGAGLRLSNATV